MPTLISFEMAQKLKAAGLTWDPQEGDLRYYLFSNFPVAWCPICDTPHDTYSGEEYDQILQDILEDSVFAPSLSQLYDEGERRGYVIQTEPVRVKLSADSDPQLRYRATVFRLYEDCLFPANAIGFFDTRDEAAAEALLWILEQDALDELENASWPTFIRECREVKLAGTELRDTHQPCREGDGDVELMRSTMALLKERARLAPSLPLSEPLRLNRAERRRVRKCDSP